MNYEKFTIVKKLISNDKKENNILIKGENLDSLNILINELEIYNYFNIIYLDPLYNNEDNELLYAEKEKKSDKIWLLDFEKRIETCLKLLNKDDGILLISIDDNEYHRVRTLLEKWFKKNEIKTIVWKSAEPTGVKMKCVKKYGTIAKLKEYIVIAKKGGVKNLHLEKVKKDKIDKEYRIYVDGISDKELSEFKRILHEDKINSKDLRNAQEIASKITFYPIKKVMERSGEMNENKDIWIKKNINRIVRDCSIESVKVKEKCDRQKVNAIGNAFLVLNEDNKVYLIKKNYNEKCKSPRMRYIFADDYLDIHIGDIWTDIKTTGLSSEGGVKFNKGKKPLKLMKRLFMLNNKKDIKVLDIYAGSGASGQAIMELNNRDGGTRRFVLIDKDLNGICENKTFKRLENSINGEEGCIKTEENLIYIKVEENTKD